MKLPAIRGVIERRILANFAVDPARLVPLLPSPFRPKLHRGRGVVGICLIRLGAVRPQRLPAWVGLSSENAAHRAAVEWDEGERVREGVFIWRRDTSSRINSLAGGRLFPGLHSHATFTVAETDSHFEVSARSDDGRTNLSVAGDVTVELPRESIFSSLAEASVFFEGGALGYSATPDPRRHEGLELRCDKWGVEALAVSDWSSSFFQDRSIFPEKTIKFDCALLMRDIAHEWHGVQDMCPRAAS